MWFLPIYVIWPLGYLYLILKNNVQDSIAKNALSFTHSVGCTILSAIHIYTNYNYNFLQNSIYHISSSYFLWDTLQILFSGKVKKNFVYIYHHIVCLLMLYEFSMLNNLDIITNLFFVGELSNFFNYIVYHLIKVKSNKLKIFGFQILQLIWFGIFRVYYFSIVFIGYFTSIENRILAYMLGSIYLMGFVWGWGQLKNTLSDGKKLLKFKEN